MRYVDTHAMAPINHPVGPGSPPLLTQLLNAPAVGAVASGATTSAAPYLNSLGIAAGQRANGAVDFYPTHFIHAIRAAQAVGRPISAYLFENDGVATGRRAAIAAWLANPPAAAIGLAKLPAWTATLAPVPGDFRNAASWIGLGPALGDGEVLLVFSDPMGFQPRVAAGANMGPADFGIIWPHFAALRPTPSIVVHVIFAVGGNAGAWPSPNPWLAATNGIHHAWSAAIAGAGLPTALPHATTARLGVQWGGFLVVACVWETGPSAQGLLAALPGLQGSLGAVLPHLWGGKLRFH